SELGIVLRDQQALLSMLLTHVALADGEERRSAFEAFAHALVAHLADWQSILLPMAGDTELAQQVAASGRLTAEIVTKTRIDQQSVTANNDIQTLMSSVLSLLSQENALLKGTFSALPHAVQLALAGAAERELVRAGVTAEFDLLGSACADRGKGVRHRLSRRTAAGHARVPVIEALTRSIFGINIP
ncbi:MAG: hypothetical protein ABI887_20130, partial [Burkholderiales bacterium]